MVQCRDRDKGTVAFTNFLTGLFIQHPLRQRELCSVRELDLNVVAGHDPEPADDCDFFAKVGMESVIDPCRRRFVGSVTVVSNVPALPMLRAFMRGGSWGVTCARARKASRFSRR